MQREIKFRGKRVDNGEWIYGCLITGFFLRGGKDIPYIMTTDGADYDCFEDIQEGNGIFEVITETVGQYTGLKDKNGKEIYEGDIAVFEDMTSTESGYWERDCIGIVVWGEETAAFEVTNRLSAESYEVLSDCEVIGNIYEHTELLLEVSE